MWVNIEYFMLDSILVSLPNPKMEEIMYNKRTKSFYQKPGRNQKLNI